MSGTQFAIVGTSNVGLAMAESLLKHKANVVLSGRDARRTKQRAKLLNMPVNIQPMLNAVVDADITLLCVEDHEIEALCKTLTINFKLGSVVAHCSADLDSSVLKSAKAKKGVLSCSLHPLHSFTNLEESLEAFRYKFHRTFLYSEGDSEALKITSAAFKKVGFLPVTVSADAKPIYNAAYVFAQDYLTALIEMSMETAEAAKIDREVFWRSLQPLIKKTLQNIDKKGAVQTLDGPIAQGDIDTIKKHLAVLDGISPNRAMAYAGLGKHALSLAVKLEQLDPKTTLKLHKLLDKAIQKKDK